MEPQIVLTEIETTPRPGPVLNLDQPSSSAGPIACRAVEDPEPVALNPKKNKKKKMEDLTSKLASALAKPGDQDSPAQHGPSAAAKPGKARGATVVPAKTGEEARQIQPASASGATVAPRKLIQTGKKRPAEAPKQTQVERSAAKSGKQDRLAVPVTPGDEAIQIQPAIASSKSAVPSDMDDDGWNWNDYCPVEEIVLPHQQRYIPIPVHPSSRPSPELMQSQLGHRILTVEGPGR